MSYYDHAVALTYQLDPWCVGNGSCTRAAAVDDETHRVTQWARGRLAPGNRVGWSVPGKRSLAIYALVALGVILTEGVVV